MYSRCHSTNCCPVEKLYFSVCVHFFVKTMHMCVTGSYSAPRGCSTWSAKLLEAAPGIWYCRCECKLSVWQETIAHGAEPREQAKHLQLPHISAGTWSRAQCVLKCIHSITGNTFCHGIEDIINCMHLSQSEC